MAILKAKDASKLNKKEREEKLKDLRLELIKANVTANRTNAKTKEIKRAISRLLTFNNMDKSTSKSKSFNKTSKEGELNKK